MPSHPSLARTDLHESKRMKASARAASTANVTTSAPGASIDGVTLVSGDRILLKDQSTGSQNGLYVWTGAAAALTRATDASAATDFLAGDRVYVREGAANAASHWTLTTSAAITLGTTSLTYVRDSVGSVTSVAMTVPTGFSVSGSPVTTSGTLAVTESTQSANTVKAGPTTGSAAAPGYRALVSADLPASPDFAIGANGQAIGIRALTELTTIAAAATTTTAIQIPAAAIVLAVSVRVTVAIPTATTFTVTGNTSGTTYNTAAVSVAANSTDPGTAAGAVYNGTAQTVRITPSATPATNVGRVRVTVFYLLSSPPTS
jgi:hypothetical protein